MKTYTEEQVVDMLRGREIVTQLAANYFWARYRAEPEWDEDGDWFTGFRHDPWIEVSFLDARTNKVTETCPCFSGDDPKYKSGAGCDKCNWTGKLTTITEIPAMIEVDARARACGRGCCGDDSHTYTFPLSYLWMDQTAILADLKATHEAKKAAEAAAKVKAEEKERRQQVAADKKRLKELAEKYPEVIAK